MENVDPELEKKQLKNLKRRIVDTVWNWGVGETVRFALFLGIKVPKNLIEKFISPDKE